MGKILEIPGRCIKDFFIKHGNYGDVRDCNNSLICKVNPEHGCIVIKNVKDDEDVFYLSAGGKPYEHKKDRTGTLTSVRLISPGVIQVKTSDRTFSKVYSYLIKNY